MSEVRHTTFDDIEVGEAFRDLREQISRLPQAMVLTRRFVGGEATEIATPWRPDAVFVAKTVLVSDGTWVHPAVIVPEWSSTPTSANITAISGLVAGTEYSVTFLVIKVGT